MEWLELYVDISESAGLKLPLMEACKSIGILHNTLVCSLCLSHLVCVCVCSCVGMNVFPYPTMSLPPPPPLQGNFERACVYFKKSYTLCREVGSPEDLHSAAVQYGIASAHVAMEGFAERLTFTDLSSVEVHTPPKRPKPPKRPYGTAQLALVIRTAPASLCACRISPAC